MARGPVGTSRPFTSTIGGLPGEKNKSLIFGALLNIAANKAGVENGAALAAGAAADGEAPAEPAGTAAVTERLAGVAAVTETPAALAVGLAGVAEEAAERAGRVVLADDMRTPRTMSFDCRRGMVKAKPLGDESGLPRS
jgi:hypothetical protein